MPGIFAPQGRPLYSSGRDELLLTLVARDPVVQFDAERIGLTACCMLLDILAGSDISYRAARQAIRSSARVQK